MIKGRSGWRRLRGPAPGRTPRRTYLIVCEGGKTERHYFHGWRQHFHLATVDVEVVGLGADPLTVVQEAVARRENRKRDAKHNLFRSAFDCVWCVFDVEQHGKNPLLSPAITLSRQKGINLALSNPCFEYWCLLHFERAGSSFQSCSDVIRQLKRYLPRYQKGDPDVFSMLLSNTNLAISNAEHIMRTQWQSQSDLAQCNPCTRVHLLVNELRDLGRTPYDH